jgi:hypothetical protein
MVAGADGYPLTYAEEHAKREWCLVRIISLATRRRAAVSKPTVLVNFLQALLAIILGNVVYFALLPSMPPAARHRPFRLDLGTLVDFFFCVVAYGLIRTARKWR